MRGAWKEVADENRNLNRQQHALSEEAGRLKERCEALKQAIGRVNLDLADANTEAKKLSAEIVEVRALPSKLKISRAAAGTFADNGGRHQAGGGAELVQEG